MEGLTSLQLLLSRKEYTYGDENWKDLLTSYNGQAITYDSQGNALTYLGHTLTWEKGRQLNSYDSNTYTYNANGIRTSKTVDGIRHDYVLDGVKILREAWGDNTLVPLYDNEEGVCGILYNNEPYYFVKNLQGDVIAIVDKYAETVAKYSYDAWGVPAILQDTTDCQIATINPFRYRGYYYDAETQLYYLQSRYYNPEIGRFINADALVSTGQGILGYNMFAYCGNNPIINSDPTGMLFLREAGGGFFGGSGGGGGGLAYMDPAVEHIAKLVVLVSIPIILPFIPPSTTYDIDILRAETMAIKKARQEQGLVKAEIATLTRQGKKPVVFPENPYDFTPQWLIRVERKGTKNGRIIQWFIPFTKIEVFRWDENLMFSNGSHYHIYKMGHFYPGWIVPEPLASWHFSHLQ